MEDKKVIENFNTLIKFIDTTFTGERREKLLKMYDELGDRVAVAPAAGNLEYHGCYAGGYVEHVLTVLNCCNGLYELWRDMGGNMEGYKLENLFFAALNHDLGKIGNEKQDYFLTNEDNWQVTKQGKVYIHNNELPMMTVPNRSIYMLQKYGIEMSEEEYISILSHDGLFDDANIVMWKPYSPKNVFKTTMPIILHHADYMAYRIELDNNKKNK